jgi:hypothetical protein
MSEPDYKEIRRRVEERFNKQKELTIHATIYVIINVLIWVLWMTGAAISLPVLSGIYEGLGMLPPVVISIGWGVGLVAHYLDYYYAVGGGAKRRERVIEEEIEREKALRAMYEKPKRNQTRLTEDGELEEMTEDEDYVPARRNRRG